MVAAAACHTVGSAPALQSGQALTASDLARYPGKESAEGAIIDRVGVASEPPEALPAQRTHASQQLFWQLGHGSTSVKVFVKGVLSVRHCPQVHIGIQSIPDWGIALTEGGRGIALPDDRWPWQSAYTAMQAQNSSERRSSWAPVICQGRPMQYDPPGTMLSIAQLKLSSLQEH
jgi:hypothetical protein